MSITEPNHVWASDITYIPMAHGFLYLVAIIDWASRAVLAWRLSNTMDTGFCIAALDEALARHGTPKLFNTDQGAQFTSAAFTGKLEAAGIVISMDGRGRFMDNIFIERLWRSIKYEEVHLKAYADGHEARDGIGVLDDFLQSSPPASGDEQPIPHGGMARRHGQNRGGEQDCGYAASLGQRKRVAHIPTADAKAAARSCLILKDKSRRDYTLTPAIPGPAYGVHFNRPSASTAGSPTNKPSSRKSPLGSTTAMPTTPRPIGNSQPQMPVSNSSISTLQSE